MSPKNGPEGPVPESSVYLQVVAAVIRGPHNTCPKSAILISKRKKDSHQGGLWEFPGGKVEPGEAPLNALKREIDEELGIMVKDARPLIKVHHHYSDKSVCLDVWEVSDFTGGDFEVGEDGVSFGKEGQPIEWVGTHDLLLRQFPKANYPILKAVLLPTIYCITPDFSNSNPSIDELACFFSNLRKTVASGCTLIQLRVPVLCDEVFKSVVKDALSICHEMGAKLILNGDLISLKYLNVDGFHLSSTQLKKLTADEGVFRGGVPLDKLLGASCHSAEELAMAESLGCDYASLSPVEGTQSHPDAQPLGWFSFSELVQAVNLPVYALGGVGKDNLRVAWENGAQGVSGISQFWG